MWIISANGQSMLSFDKDDSICITKCQVEDVWDENKEKARKIYALQLSVVRKNNAQYSLKAYFSYNGFDKILIKAKEDLKQLVEKIDSTNDDYIKMEPGNYYEKETE